MSRPTTTTEPDVPALEGAIGWAVELGRDLFAVRWRVLTCAVVGGAAGVVVALVIPSQYTSSAAFIARGSSNLNLPSGLLGAAASLGLDRSGDYSPKFYADLLTSRPILESAVQHQYVVPGRDSTHLASYIEIAGFASQDSAHALNNAIKHLVARVGASDDVRSNLVTLTVRTHWPRLSRDVARQLLNALDSLNVSFRQTQSRDLREFYETRVAQTRLELDSAERAVRSFMQENRTSTSPSLQFELQRLQRGADLKQTLYATVVQQYEQARLQEARSVPTVTVLAPPYVPIEKSSPPRRLIVLIGVLVGVAAVLLQLRLAQVVAFLQTQSTARSTT